MSLAHTTLILGQGLARCQVADWVADTNMVRFVSFKILENLDRPYGLFRVYFDNDFMMCVLIIIYDLAFVCFV